MHVDLVTQITAMAGKTPWPCLHCNYQTTSVNRTLRPDRTLPVVPGTGGSGESQHDSAQRFLNGLLREKAGAGFHSHQYHITRHF